MHEPDINPVLEVTGELDVLLYNRTAESAADFKDGFIDAFLWNCRIDAQERFLQFILVEAAPVVTLNIIAADMRIAEALFAKRNKRIFKRLFIETRGHLTTLP